MSPRLREEPRQKWTTRVFGLLYDEGPPFETPPRFGCSQEGGFPKGLFWKMFPRPPKPERGYNKRNDGTKSRNERTRNGTTVPKTGTRAHSPDPPFYKTTLLFPLDRLPALEVTHNVHQMQVNVLEK